MRNHHKELKTHFVVVSREFIGRGSIQNNSVPLPLKSIGGKSIVTSEVCDSADV